METATLTPQTEAPTTALETEKSDTLTLLDRCDRCNAQAYVQVNTKKGGTLLFCNHEYNANKKALAPSVESIVDETWKLTFNRHLGDEKS